MTSRLSFTVSINNSFEMVGAINCPAATDVDGWVFPSRTIFLVVRRWGRSVSVDLFNDSDLTDCIAQSGGGLSVKQAIKAACALERELNGKARSLTRWVNNSAPAAMLAA
jgi:hypothetical protein